MGKVYFFELIFKLIYPWDKPMKSWNIKKRKPSIKKSPRRLCTVEGLDQNSGHVTITFHSDGWFVCISATGFLHIRSRSKFQAFPSHHQRCRSPPWSLPSPQFRLPSPSLGVYSTIIFKGNSFLHPIVTLKSISFMYIGINLCCFWGKVQQIWPD